MRKTVFTDYLSTHFKDNEKAHEVLQNIKEQLPEDLYYRMQRCLVGFQDDLQMAIAANLRDCVCYGFERYTFIDHVDDMLKGLYLAIDKDLDRI